MCILVIIRYLGLLYALLLYSRNMRTYLVCSVLRANDYQLINVIHRINFHIILMLILFFSLFCHIPRYSLWLRCDFRYLRHYAHCILSI